MTNSVLESGERSAASTSTGRARRTGPLDRLAMRLGLALLLWSRRERRRNLSFDERQRLLLAAEESRCERERMRWSPPPVL
jgi:hypothetical protein